MAICTQKHTENSTLACTNTKRFQATTIYQLVKCGTFIFKFIWSYPRTHIYNYTHHNITYNFLVVQMPAVHLTIQFARFNGNVVKWTLISHNDIASSIVCCFIVKSHTWSGMWRTDEKKKKKKNVNRIYSGTWSANTSQTLFNCMETLNGSFLFFFLLRHFLFVLDRMLLKCQIIININFQRTD